MKIKDLPPRQSVENVAFKHPQTGATCYWRSQWGKGVWYRKSLGSNQVFVIPLNDISEALEFELK